MMLGPEKTGTPGPTGHEVGSKVRSIWAGRIGDNEEEEEEVVVSGGFDKRVFIWRVEKEIKEIGEVEVEFDALSV